MTERHDPRGAGEERAVISHALIVDTAESRVLQNLGSATRPDRQFIGPAIGPQAGENFAQLPEVIAAVGAYAGVAAGAEETAGLRFGHRITQDAIESGHDHFAPTPMIRPGRVVVVAAGPGLLQRQRCDVAPRLERGPPLPVQCVEVGVLGLQPFAHAGQTFIGEVVVNPPPV